MWHRFFTTIYFLLHIPLLIIPFWVVSESGDPLIGREYKVKCLSNNQYVVLQGSAVDTPDTFSSAVLQGEFKAETESNLRFYCTYYDEIRPHILAYREARSVSEEVQANKAFWAFKESKKISGFVPQDFFAEKYKLEVVSTDYGLLMSAILGSILGVIFYYLLLQVLRMIYTYIVKGKIVFHPYRFPR